MKRIVLALILVASATGLPAQDWMKADWYSTKKQVIAREGSPASETKENLEYDRQLAGTPVRIRYEFMDSMLQGVVLKGNEGSGEALMAYAAEAFGKPVHQVLDGYKKGYYWKIKGGWLQAVAYSGVGYLALLPDKSVLVPEEVIDAAKAR